MKKMTILAILFAFALLLCACAAPAQSAPAEEPAAEEAPAAAAAAEDGAYDKYILSNTIYGRDIEADDKSVVGKLTAVIPSFRMKDESPNEPLEALNYQIGDEATVWFDDNYNEYAESCKEDAKERGADFTPYGFENVWELSYFKDDVISFRISQYAQTGGAHPSTIIKGATYDLAACKKLELGDVLNCSAEEAKKMAREGFLAMVKADPTSFMEDAETTLAGDLPIEWYLNGEGVVFVLEDYAIAPHAYGIPEYTLSRAANADLFKV